MDPVNPNDQKTGEAQDRGQGAAATAKSPTAAERIDAATSKEGVETQAGYAPLRSWINQRIRNRGVPITLKHGGADCEVEELIIDGRLRLKMGDAFVLVPLDERYIPELFEQIL